MKKTTRREFIKLSGLGMATMTIPSCNQNIQNKNQEKQKELLNQLRLGMASYTFREFNLEDTIFMTKRLGLKRICFKSFHLPLESTEDEIRIVAHKVKESGLELYGCGVVYMKNMEEVNHAFNYAKTAGMEIIIGVPNHELLDIVNERVQEFDIKLAIHNHGPDDKLYPTPKSAYEKIKGLDSRIGLCIDVGHTQRAGVNPSESVKNFRDRLLDVHIKDVTAPTKQGQTVEMGRGVIDIPKFLQTLIKLNYTDTISFEFEKDAADPLPGVAESIGYVRGILSVI